MRTIDHNRAGSADTKFPLENIMATHLRIRQFGFSVFAVLLALCTLLIITTLAFAKPTNTIIANPGDSIQAAIDAALPGDTILINAGMYTESLTLSKAVSLTGVDSTTVILHALPEQRVLTVTDSAVNNTVVISGLTLTGGNLAGGFYECNMCGGGVFVTGGAWPQMTNLRITGNYADYRGGGIYLTRGSPLSLSNSSVTENTSSLGAGGIYSEDAVTLTNVLVADNHTGLGGGGGLTAYALYGSHSEFARNSTESEGGGASVIVAELDGFRFANNSAGGSGGGLYILGTPSMLSSTIFVSNTSFTSGGGLYTDKEVTVSGGSFISNAAPSGGGLYAAASNSTKNINAVEFVGNVATFGGGASIFGPATVVSGRFVQNQSSNNGGGLYAFGLFSLSSTQFISNAAVTNGGGLYYLGGRASIANTVFAHNTVISDQSAAAIAVYSTGNVTLTNLTITDPGLNPQAAIKATGANVSIGGNVFIFNTLITNHAIGILRQSGLITEDYNLYFSNTLNLSNTTSSGVHNVFGDPRFVSQTTGDYHLNPDSAAVDTGVDMGIFTDLDGSPRPSKLWFDIGAYEFQYSGSIYKSYLPLIRK
jgi:predicted outer membrane repeat protein